MGRKRAWRPPRYSASELYSRALRKPSRQICLTRALARWRITVTGSLRERWPADISGGDTPSTRARLEGGSMNRRSFLKRAAVTAGAAVPFTAFIQRTAAQEL